MSEPADITALLAEWRRGSETAFEELAPAVYDHLRTVAEGYLRGERPGHTLQATALVHEVFLRLIHNKSIAYCSREHFFTFGAKVMRRILVDHARAGGTKKRGENRQRVTLAPELAWVDAASEEMLDLERALTEFASLYPEKIETLEVRFFLGATSLETGEILGRSRSAVDREVNFAISWLHQRLKQKSSG